LRIIDNYSYYVQNMDVHSLNPDCDVENTRIVIVGAGIAGLGAAVTLEQSNFKDYIILEGDEHIFL
jgi:ribulose 1,5-bisphosphate synthetase/thiazole synthase